MNSRTEQTSEKGQDRDFQQPGDLAGLVLLHGKLLPWDLLS